MSQVEMVVIRHGQTNWNGSGRIQGYLDVPLNERGLKQARGLRQSLAGERFDKIYSSDLQRTLETAAPAARMLAMEVHTHEGLREWNLGSFEDLTVEEAFKQSEAAYHAYRNMDPDHTISGGESLRAFADRCIGAMEEIASAHAGERILVFTHGGVVINLLRKTRGVAMGEKERYWVPNTAIVTFKVTLSPTLTWEGYETEEEIIPWR